MVAVLLLILGVILFLVIAIAVYIFKTQRTLVNLDELCKNSIPVGTPSSLWPRQQPNTPSMSQRL